MRSIFVVQNAILSARLSKKIGIRLSVHGISFNEFIVMDYLFRNSDRSVSRLELAEHVGMSGSGITRLVAPMEKNRIIKKESNFRDARQSLIALTETGVGIYKEARGTFEHIAVELTRYASENEISRGASLFEKLL